MPGNYLKTDFAERSEVRGSYRLILFSGSFPQHLGRIAFLDCAGDGVEFIPYAADDEFRTVSGLAPADALAQAEAFVSHHPDFRRASLAKVLAEDGTILGFEVRPLYSQSAFGATDVLDVSYRRKGGSIIITVHLQDAVERQLIGS